MTESNIASDLINKNLTDFGRSIIEAQHPNPVDGLKPVHRRILIKVETKGTVAIKSAKIVGEIMELHPHGDSSIYNTAVRMGQGFEYNPPLLDFRSESSGGTYANPKAGNSRYTSFKVPEFTRDVFFSGIELKALPKKLDEFLTGYELLYFAPSIPTALLYANNSIGYGESSYTVSHNLADICDLVVAYVNHQKTNPTEPFDYARHAEKFLPDFPVQGILTNSDELLEAYRAGDFNKRIKLDGDVRLTSDTIHILTLPYGVTFKNLEESIQLLMSSKENKNGWFDKNLLTTKDLSNEYEVGDIIVRVKRGVNVFEAWELLRKKIQFSGTIIPIPNYNVDGYTVSLSRPTLLAIWYEVRRNVLVSSKKLKIMELSKSVRRVEALLVICDHVDEVIAIIRVHGRSKESVALLIAKFDLTDFQATYLTEAPLYTISTAAAIDLNERKLALEAQLLEIRESFSKIPDEIAREALAVKKKYASPRRSRIPNYMGYVKIGGGCIQYESTEEISQIIQDFPKDQMEIYSYDGPHLYKVSDNKKLERGYIPKITTGDIYGLKTNNVITVNITDGTACCVKGFVPGLRTEGYFYTTPKSRVIYRNGEIKVVDVTEEISLRKTICRGASTNIIYVYPDVKQDHYVIALNTASPNVILIQKVSADKSKIGMNPTGEVMVLHNHDRHIFLNIPQRFLNRNATRVVEIIDVEKVLEGRDQVRLDIASAKVKSNKLIRLL